MTLLTGRGRTLAPLLGAAAILASVAAAFFSAASARAALAPGEIVVADARAYGGCSSGCGGLTGVDPVSGAETTIASNAQPVNASSQLFNVPFTLAIDSSGDVLAANTYGLGGSCPANGTQGCGGVLKVDPTSGEESVLSANSMPINASSQYFLQPTGMTIAPNGDILVADWGKCSGCGKVIKVDPANGKETLVSSNSMPVNASSQLFTYVQGIAVDGSGEIFIGDPLAFGGIGGVIEVDPATGKETKLSANDLPVNASSQYFHAPLGVAVDGAGDVLVDDWGPCTFGCGAVIKVDPANGKETLVSSNSMPVNSSSQYLHDPTGIALDSSGNIILGNDSGFGGSCAGGCGAVIKVDPTSGKQSLVATNSMPVNASSQLFEDPFSVAVAPGAEPAPQSASSEDPQPPETTITRVKVKSRHKKAKFAFTASGGEGPLSFECKLDKRRYSSCISPRVYRHLKPGRHRFAVIALDAAGRVDPVPAIRKFRIRA